MKKLFIFGFIACVAMPLFAKKSLPNKDQVFFTNAYGADVAVSLVWEGGIFPSEQEFILKSHHAEKMFKAPYSGYHLTEVSVTPAINVTGKELAQMATVGASLVADYVSDGSKEQQLQNQKLTTAASKAVDLSYAVAKALNKDILRVRGDKYFIIEKTKEATKIPGQRKIVIKDYVDKKAYEKQLEKIAEKSPDLIEPKIEQQSMAKVLQNAQKNISQSNMHAQQKLTLEKRRLALQLEQLALEEQELVLAE